MKFRIVVILGVLASVLAGEGEPFGEFDIASLAEYESGDVRRDKRSLTTICVEIKPSSPYEEPYFMCKGTDMPQFSKGGSYSGGGSESSYAPKPSYKPKPSYSESDNHSPVKSDYHSGESKYGKPPAYESHSDYSAPSKPSYDKKPSFTDHGSHGEYSGYEAPKPTAYGHGDYSKPSAYGHDDYTKPAAHKPVYEKPSPHYESSYSSKPQSYSHESPSHGHSEPSEYSKPSGYHQSSSGYSRPTSYSDHSSYSPSKPSYNEPSTKPAYSEPSPPKPSYGQSGTSYSAASKPGYSKPGSYGSKPSVYENSDHASYAPAKPSYGEQKPYAKPAPASYSKPPSYPTDAYSAPATKPYPGSEKGFGHDHPASYGKPAHSVDAYSAPAAEPYEKGYGQHKTDSSHSRSMSDDLMQPMWDMQPLGPQADSFGYRAMGSPMDQDHQLQQYTAFDGPTKMDLPGPDRDGPTLQSPYLYSAPTPAMYGQDVSYGPAPYSPAAPSYVPVVPSYVPVAPTYAPAGPYYPPAAPSYGTSAPSYGSAIQSYAHPTQVFKPPCQQSFLYSFQPAIVSLPCLSTPPANYGHTAYSQPLGAAPSSTLGETHQLYPSNINPLQDHGAARSEGNSESGKPVDDSSDSLESQEDGQKPDPKSETSQKLPKKSESSKTIDPKEEKPAEKTQAPKVDTAKPKEDQGPDSVKENDESSTRQAHETMIRLSKIAAQIKKDDNNQGGDSGPTVPGGDKAAGSPFGRS